MPVARVTGFFYGLFMDSGVLRAAGVQPADIRPAYVSDIAMTGPLDSIIQAGGRCNRHGEYGPGGGSVTLIRLIDEDHHQKEFHS